MESASIASPPGASAGPMAREGDKGLKAGALGYLSNLVIGVASTAPGYSLAATLGFITAVVAFHAPAIMLLSFVPMLLIAASYYYFNRADPDCGTSFTCKNFIMGGVAPFLGGAMLTAIFIKAYIDYKPADANYGGDFHGVGVSVAIGVGLLLVGVVLLVISNFVYPDFFKRKWEVAEPGILEGEVTGEASVMEDPA